MTLKLVYSSLKQEIAVDIDDTILEFINPFLIDYNTRNKTSFKKSDLEGHFFLSSVLNISPERLQHEFNAFYATQAFLKLPLIEGASSAIKLLTETSRFFVVTTRPNYIKDKTLSNLALYFNGSFNGVSFVSRESKSARYAEMEVKKVIDDDLTALLNIPEESKIEALLIDQPWNKCDNLPPYINRVGNWKKGISPWPEIVSRLK